MALRIQDDASYHPQRPYLEVAQQATSFAPSSSVNLQRQSLPSYSETPLPRSNSPIPQSTLLRQQSFPRPKILWGRKSCDRPFYPQQLHNIKILQDARYLQDSQLYSPPRSLHLNRPFQRLLPYSGSSSLPKVPRLHLQKSTLHIPIHALRNQARTTYIHQGNLGGTKEITQRPHSSISLYRRLAPVEHLPSHPLQKHSYHRDTPDESRVYNQPGKVSTLPPSVHYLPRRNLEWPGFFPRTKRTEHPEGIPGSTDHCSQPHYFQKEVSEIPRINKLHRPLRVPWTLPSASGDHGSPKVQRSLQPSVPSQATTASSVVDIPTELTRSDSDLATTSTAHDLDRRVPFWVGGSLLPKKVRLGNLVCRRPTTPHQPSGGQSGLPISEETKSQERDFPFNQDRQHSSCLSPKQTGFQPHTSAQPHPPSSPTALLSGRVDSASQTHPGSPELMGGFSIEKSRHSFRMDPCSTVLQPDSPASTTADRSVCTPRQRETSSVRLYLSPPSRICSRRSVCGLEQVAGNLPLSSVGPHPPGPYKIRKLHRQRGPYRPIPTFSSLVARTFNPVQAIRRRAKNFAARPRQTSLGTRRDILDLSRTQFLTKIFESKFPPPVAKSLISSTRVSTNTQYGACWKHFQSWLSSKEDLAISKGSILLYLEELGSSRNLNPKTILVYRNALHLPLLHGFRINTKDNEFSMLSRSQFITNPPQQRLVPNWDPSVVLSMLEKPEYDTDSASPQNLLSKSLFLVSLATGNRASEIAAMSRHSITFSPEDNQVTIPVRPGFLYKNQSLSRSPPNITIPALLLWDGSRHSLCPVKALRAWLQLSTDWGSDAVFVNPKSHCPMNRGAISSQLVRTINNALPHVFARAHDVRKVSASLAWARGITPTDISKSMFWTSSNVFIKKYLSTFKVAQPCVVASHATII